MTESYSLETEDHGRDRSNSGNRSGAAYLRGYDSTNLANRLTASRERARKIMQEFNIPTGHICVMARLAGERISDTALRAEFLLVLIDVHEFGREARRRKLAVPDATGDAEPIVDQAPDVPETALFAPSKGASDAVSRNASREFFSSLDRLPGPDAGKRSMT